MERRDGHIDTDSREVAEIISVEPLSEAAVSDVVEAMPGVVVATVLTEDAEPLPFDLDTSGVSGTCSRNEDEAADEPLALHRNGKLKHVLECMLFVSTEPVSAKELADVLQIDQDSVEQAMNDLEENLETGSGLQLMRVAGAYQLCTRAEYADYCAIILRPAAKKLSKAALETLAIVAYRQPCTMPEVEAVRGVSVDGVMKTLMDRGLVKESGRKQTPGRPILYATTPEFLEYFGLNDISELPDIDMLAVEEIKALEAQKELFTTSNADREEPESASSTEEQ